MKNNSNINFSIEKPKIITVKIQPNAKKTCICEDSDITAEIVKIKIAAPPVDNKANKKLIEFLSELFKLPKSNFEIISGANSKIKRIKIT